MKLAAIDIGSNAVRLLIQESQELDDGSVYFRKISLTRVPIRLGEDVFTDGKITNDKAKKLVKVMKAFRLLMEANEVEMFRGCATSAMREAENGETVRELIKRKANIKIELIQGEEEAELIFNHFTSSGFDKKHTYLYIDVGGGSTEVTLIKKGKRVKSYSFKLGTVRILKKKEGKTEWNDAINKIEKMIDGETDVIAIGTGGNINRIFKESSCKRGERIKRTEIKSILKEIESYTYEDRIKKLKLKPDRADVIVPAGKIYSSFMKAGNSKEMIVPKVGLSDGVILKMYNDFTSLQFKSEM